MVLETSIGILAGVFVVAMGMAVALLVQQRRQLRLARARASAEAFVDSIEGPSESASFESSVRRLGTRLSAGSFSLKLRDKLASTGFYKVMMTRDRDVFIPLEERRRYAERNQAALFIAIHADYAERASARGATIYALRSHVADALRRSAEAEMRDAVLSGKQVALAKQAEADVDALRGILTDKARDLIERNQVRTSMFARSIIDFVGSSTNLMENPDRTAGFAVLRTAKVPAILLELGYVTNEADAAQLKSDVWRDRVASAMVAAINKYVGDCLEKPAC